MKNIVLIFLSFFTISALAQEEIIIPGEVNRKIENAYRIAEQPIISDSINRIQAVEYPLLSIKLPIPMIQEKIKPATIKSTEKLAQLYRGYVKLGIGGGIGSGIMPVGEAYYNQARSRKWLWGVHARHHSASGNIKKYAPSSNDFSRIALHGGYNVRDMRIRADGYYQSQGTNYYGFESPKTKRDSIAQRYQGFGFNAGFLSQQLDSLNLNFSIDAGYYHFNTRKQKDALLKPWRAEEDHFGINSKFWYKFDQHTFRADFDININKYGYGIRDSVLPSGDSGMIYRSTVVSFRPHVVTQSRDFKLKAKAGFDLSIEGGTFARPYIYPIAEVTYSLFNDILVPYAGLRGGLKQNTFKRLVEQNPFILQGVQSRSESKAFELYGGLKGTISRRVSFNLGGSFARHKNVALFVTDTLATSRDNQFKTIYDTIDIAQFEGSLSYQLNEKMKFDGIVNLYSYNCFTNIYAWNMPTVKVTTRFNYNLYSKFLINLDANIQTGRRAKVYSQIAGAKEENGQYAIDLGAIVDINLGLEYRYSPRFSMFFNVNNVASQQYKRFLNYPTYGIQALGGFTFKF